MFDIISPEAFVMASLIAFVAGWVKGMVGFALPLIMISGLSSFLDPKIALAGMLFCVVSSNIWQILRTGLGPAWEAAKIYWRYVLMVCVAIFVAAQWINNLSPQAFYLILGVPVVILSLIQLLGVTVRIAPAHRGWAEWVVGGVSGVLGGLTGTWGPITVLYLLAVETPKARQMVVQGVIYGTGAVMLFLGHLRSGVLNADTWMFSVAMMVPAFAGMFVGFRLSDKMSPEVFKRITLIVLLIGGLNLLRKAAVG